MSNFIQDILCGDPPNNADSVCGNVGIIGCSQYWREQMGMGPALSEESCRAAMALYAGGTIAPGTLPQNPGGGVTTGYGPAYDAQEEIKRQQQANQMYVILAIAAVAAVFFLRK